MYVSSLDLARSVNDERLREAALLHPGLRKHWSNPIGVRRYATARSRLPRLSLSWR